MTAQSTDALMISSSMEVCSQSALGVNSATPKLFRGEHERLCKRYLKINKKHQTNPAVVPECATNGASLVQVISPTLAAPINPD